MPAITTQTLCAETAAPRCALPPSHPTSTLPAVAPLVRLNDLRQPMLFVCGEFDRLCPGSRLKQCVTESMPDVDARVVVLEVRGMCGVRCGGVAGGR